MQAPTPQWRKWYVLGVLFLAAVLSYTDRLILNPLVEPLRLDLGLSDVQVSLLQGAAFAVIYSVAALPLGRLADIARRRNLLVMAIVLWTTGTVLCGLSRSFYQLFGARLMVGMGEAALFPAGMSLLLSYFPAQQRATAIGIFFMGAPLGAGVAILSAGVLLGVFNSVPSPWSPNLVAPWRCVLLTLAVPGIIVCALLLAVVEPVRPKPAMDVSRAEGAPGIFGGWSPVLAFLLLALMFQAVADYGAGAWLPSLLVRRFALSPVEAAIQLGQVVLVAAILGPVIGGLLADFLYSRGLARYKPIAAAIPLLAGVPLSYLCFASTARQTIALFGALTVTMGIGVVTAVAAIQDIISDRIRGTVVAVQSFVQTIVGLGCGPTIVALISGSRFGQRDLGVCIACVIVPSLTLSAAFALTVRRPYAQLLRVRQLCME